MRHGLCLLSILLLSMLLAGCIAQSGKNYRPQARLDGEAEQLNIQCDGDFDQPPRLRSGKAPVFPISMLNPTLVDDRKTRHLPMRWDIESSFAVDADGRTRAVASTVTDPPSFGRHANAAITQWRFQPALRAGTATTANCTFAFAFQLD